MTSYLDRYLAGEHEQVWDELMALGAAVREEPLYTDALAVAHETMRRARFNVEMIIERLRATGYEFYVPEFVYNPPPANIDRLVAELTHVAGAIPLSLQVWYELVGEVGLWGSHPDWMIIANSELQPFLRRTESITYIDPLVILPLEEMLWHYKEEVKYENERVSSQPANPTGIEIAPDTFHKAAISGGGPDIIILPDMRIDGMLCRTEVISPETSSMVQDFTMRAEDIPFVQYLRRSFRWGGFPGFANVDENLRPAAMLAQLTAGLLPI
jgi:hypothetical protein